jgi:hypothetical protein
VPGAEFQGGQAGVVRLSNWNRDGKGLACTFSDGV